MTDVDRTTDVVAPPAGLRFAYRFLGWRIEEPYRAWLLADLADPTWLRRYRLRNLAFVTTVAGVCIAFVQWRYQRFPLAGLGGFLGGALGPFLFPDRVRQQVARRQLLARAETTWWHRLSNQTWTAINIALVVAVLTAAVVGLDAIERDDRAEQAAVTCATPSPEVTVAVLERFGNSEVYRPTVQVDAPGNAVLVRVGPPVSLYVAVTRRADATLDVLPVELVAPGIYQQAIDDLDSCV